MICARSLGPKLGLHALDIYSGQATVILGASGTALALSANGKLAAVGGTDGRVVGCNIIRSSGNSALDSATCNIIRRRAKYVPARDNEGNPTTDTLTTPPITWRLEG